MTLLTSCYVDHPNVLLQVPVLFRFRCTWARHGVRLCECAYSSTLCSVPTLIGLRPTAHRRLERRPIERQHKIACRWPNFRHGRDALVEIPQVLADAKYFVDVVGLVTSSSTGQWTVLHIGRKTSLICVKILLFEILDERLGPDIERWSQHRR